MDTGTGFHLSPTEDPISCPQLIHFGSATVSAKKASFYRRGMRKKIRKEDEKGRFLKGSQDNFFWMF